MADEVYTYIFLLNLYYSVQILDEPKGFKPEMLSEVGYTAGVSVMTKITSQLLDILKEKHNFR